MHNRQDHESIRRVQELRDLSVEEAARFLNRERYVESVRREAERQLDAHLPTEFGSEFVEAFCLRAPEIAVSWAKQDWDIEQSFGLRLIVNVRCIVNQELGAPWFALEVSRVTDLAPKVLHVTISPGDALAQFAKNFRTFYPTDKEQKSLLSGDARELDGLLRRIAYSVFDVPAYVTQGHAGPIPGVSQLEDIFDTSGHTYGVLPSAPPTKRELVAVLRAHNLMNKAEGLARVENQDEVTELCEAELDELSRLIQREGTHIQQRKAIEIRNSLGSGRPIKDGRDPEKLFLRQNLANKVNAPNSMRELALAYLGGITPTPGPSRHWIADETRDIEYKIQAMDALHTKPHEVGVEQREAAGSHRRTYLEALHRALKKDDDFLNRFFSN